MTLSHDEIQELRGLFLIKLKHVYEQVEEHILEKEDFNNFAKIDQHLSTLLALTSVEHEVAGS